MEPLEPLEAMSGSMPIPDVRTAQTALKPPRAMAWVLLLASAAAVLLTGLVATALIFRDPTQTLASVPPRFWGELGLAAALTIVSLVIRSLRWIFLLRRADTRIPIRDAYIGYFAGLSLLLTPFLIGEIAVRAAVLRARGRVPVATTIVVNLWERVLDMAALAAIAGIAGLTLERPGWWAWGLVAIALLTGVSPVRRVVLASASAIATPAARRFDEGTRPETRRLGQTRSWAVSLLASVMAWVLPGIAFWRLAGLWDVPFGIVDAEYAYAMSAGLGGLVLAPGGVLVAGSALLDSLAGAGLAPETATLTVFGIRVATVGVATAMGVVFASVHVRTAPLSSATHFDEIADAYDVQIPESRREALLARKTELMREVLTAIGTGRSGLDVGCGQGAYVGRMRELGFDVSGIDASAGQVAIAERRLGTPGVVCTGSVLEIPAASASYDFVYVINVLHHLGSIDEQRRAFAELLRVLKPGGRLFLHEINTRNVLFRFYMGYVFPSLNCIDEGVERWIRADRLAHYTGAPIVDVRYFTFLPDFVPRAFVSLFGPVERLLERSPLRVYSAHYMAVLRKPTYALRATADKPS